MRCSILALITCGLTACGSSSNTDGNDNPPASPAESEIAVSEPPATSLLERVSMGDRTVCGDVQAHQKIKTMLLPDLPSAHEQELANKYFSRNFPIISSDIWSSEWDKNTSITESAPISYDEFSKTVTCSANFSFAPLGLERFSFSLQPSADNTQLLYNVMGGFSSEQNKSLISAKLVKLAIDRIKDEGINKGPSEGAVKSQQEQLIDSFFQLQDSCRGGGNDTATEKACNQWGEVSTKLKALGVCYGRKDEATYQWKMHPCDTGSNGMPD